MIDWGILVPKSVEVEKLGRKGYFRFIYIYIHHLKLSPCLHLTSFLFSHHPPTWIDKLHPRTSAIKNKATRQHEWNQTSKDITQKNKQEVNQSTSPPSPKSVYILHIIHIRACEYTQYPSIVFVGELQDLAWFRCLNYCSLRLIGANKKHGTCEFLRLGDLQPIPRFVDIGAIKDAFMEFEECCDGFPPNKMFTWRCLVVKLDRTGTLWCLFDLVLHHFCWLGVLFLDGKYEDGIAAVLPRGSGFSASFHELLV